MADDYCINAILLNTARRLTHMPSTLKVKEQIIQLIKNNKGITASSICQHFSLHDKNEVKSLLNGLTDEGIIALMRSRYYPVLRLIMVYDKQSEEVVEEIELDSLTAGELQNAFSNNENDPLFFGVYDLNNENSTFFTRKYKLKFSFTKNHYQLIATFEKELN